jgi:hypothetical protein
VHHAICGVPKRSEGFRYHQILVGVYFLSLGIINDVLSKHISGWWFQTLFLILHFILWDVILPIDFHSLHHFSRWLFILHHQTSMIIYGFTASNIASPLISPWMVPKRGALFRFRRDPLGRLGGQPAGPHPLHMC